MKRVKFLKIWSITVGAMDTLIGLWLIFAPADVLEMLRIAHPAPDAEVFLSWVGVFVLTVGLSYGFALGKRGRGEAVWMFTSLARILVAVFLTVRILDGSMPTNWALVALADATLAIVQTVVLRAGWWREVHR